MGEQSLGNMNRNATQEDEEQEEPLELFAEGAQERALATTVAEDGTTNITHY